MIYCEEELESPKIVRGESPSVVQTVVVFSDDPDDEFDEEVAYVSAATWAKEHLPKDVLPYISERVTCKSIAGEVLAPRDYRYTITHNAWNPESVSYSRTGGGKTARIKFGETISCAGVNGTTPINYSGGIGYSNGAFEGVDMPVPGSQFSIGASYPYEFYTPEYERMLNSFRGCVNADTFGIYAAGEVMFLDASVAKSEKIGVVEVGKPYYFWRITFQFEASPNMTGLTNCGTLPPIAKYGQDCYWVDTIAAAAGQTLTRKPIGHYTVRPWTSRWVDFSLLWVPDYRLQYGEEARFL